MGMICLFFWKLYILLDERQFSHFIVPISNLLFKVVFHHRAIPGRVERKGEEEGLASLGSDILLGNLGGAAPSPCRDPHEREDLKPEL